MTPRRPDPAAAWPAVVRAAGVAAVLVAVAAGALHGFAGVGAEALVICSAVVAVFVGSRLPPAAPAFLRPIDDGEQDDLTAV